MSDKLFGIFMITFGMAFLFGGIIGLLGWDKNPAFVEAGKYFPLIFAFAAGIILTVVGVWALLQKEATEKDCNTTVNKHKK